MNFLMSHNRWMFCFVLPAHTNHNLYYSRQKLRWRRPRKVCALEIKMRKTAEEETNGHAATCDVHNKIFAIDMCTNRYIYIYIYTFIAFKHRKQQMLIHLRAQPETNAHSKNASACPNANNRIEIHHFFCCFRIVRTYTLRTPQLEINCAHWWCGA